MPLKIVFIYEQIKTLVNGIALNSTIGLLQRHYYKNVPRSLVLFIFPTHQHLFTILYLYSQAHTLTNTCDYGKCARKLSFTPIMLCKRNTICRQIHFKIINFHQNQ